MTKTIVFNEDTDEFINEVSYGSSTYMRLYNDFFTVGNNAIQSGPYVWRHEQPDMLWFYGDDKQAIISFYENCRNEQKDATSLTKYFESQDIHCDHKDMYSIEWSTEFQDGKQFPFRDKKRFWSDPEYKEHHYHVPIMINQQAKTDAFEPESSMQGTWLKTTITYKARVSTYIKNIMTFFRISKA